MATTIGALAYKISADTNEFKKGMALTNKELRFSKRLMQDMKTPTEQLSEAKEKLFKMLEAGAIDAKTYNRALADLEEQQKSLARSTEKTNAVLEKKVGAFTKITGAVTAVGVSISAIDTVLSRASQMLGSIGDQFAELKESIKFQKILDISSKDLESLAQAARDTGVDFDHVTDGLLEMQKKINEAVLLDGGTGKDALWLLGINPEQIQALKDPMKQFEMIVDRIDGIKNRESITLILDEMFAGEGQQFVTFIENYEEAMEKAREDVEKFGTALTESQVKDISAANKAFSDLHQSMQGLVTQMLAISAPEFKEFAESLAELVQQWTKFLGENPTALITAIEDLNAVLMELAEVVRVLLPDSLQKIRQRGLFGGLAQQSVENTIRLNPLALAASALGLDSKGFAQSVTGNAFDNPAGLVNPLAHKGFQDLGKESKDTSKNTKDTVKELKKMSRSLSEQTNLDVTVIERLLF